MHAGVGVYARLFQYNQFLVFAVFLNRRFFAAAWSGTGCTNGNFIYINPTAETVAKIIQAIPFNTPNSVPVVFCSTEVLTDGFYNFT